MLSLARIIIFLIGAVLIAVIDLRSRRIPDILLLLCGAALVVYDLLFAPSAMPRYALAACGSFIFFLIVYRLRGGLGLGDVKYAALIGYFLGIPRIMGGLLLASLAALAVWLVGHFFCGWKKEMRLPFAPFLGAGAGAAALLPDPWSLLP
jgi:prepilin signal peptidase PulO-like enzyme (type II secretory pathway)